MMGTTSELYRSLREIQSSTYPLTPQGYILSLIFILIFYFNDVVTVTESGFPHYDSSYHTEKGTHTRFCQVPDCHSDLSLITTIISDLLLMVKCNHAMSLTQVSHASII